MKSFPGGAQRQSGGGSSSTATSTNTVTMSSPYGRLTGGPAPMPPPAPVNLNMQRDSMARPYEERNILPPIQSAYGNPSSQYGFGGPAAPNHPGLKLPSIQAYQPQESYAPYPPQPQPQEPQQPGPQEYDVEAYRNHYQQSRGPPRTRSIIDSQYAAGPPSNRAYISREPVIRTSSPNREMKRYHDSKLMNSAQTWNTGPSDRDRQREESSSTSPRGGNDLRKRPSSSELPGLPRKQLHTSWDPAREGSGGLMPISDLVSPTFPSPSTNLSPTASLAAPQPPKFIYHLSMRQQPHSARACGFGDRDRRVIDPPPILELKITTPSVPSPTSPTELVPLATDAELHAQLRKVYYVCHCSLWSADTDEDSSNMTDITSSGSRATQRRLMGTLVSAPFVGHDDSTPPVTSCFFTFPDLSCRTTGRYRLHFSLVLLDPPRMVQGDKRPFLAECTSDVVRVFAAKDFPGMRGSSALTKVLKSQGCAIGVKKGIERVGERDASSASGSRAGAAARKEREEALRNVAAVAATAGAAGGNALPQEGEALAAEGDDDDGPGS